MIATSIQFFSRRIAVIAFTAALVLSGSRVSYADTPPETFATPEEAVQALVNALKANDNHAVLKVLGPDARSIVNSGDPVADGRGREHFLLKYDEKNSLLRPGGDKVFLQVGNDDWPFPIPLVKTDAGWHFDTKEGEEEILDRRIGANELAAIQSCLAYVDAQKEYYLDDPTKSSLLHYAQRIESTPGKKDGLYWSTKPDEEESPLGPLFAQARAEGYEKTGSPYHGYLYRILTAQGASAKGGAYDYMAHGKLIGGFALVAYPAKYDNSGVMTFIVNQDGIVYEKDLGPNTAAVAKAMKTFNPDDSWKRAETLAANEASD